MKASSWRPVATGAEVGIFRAAGKNTTIIDKMSRGQRWSGSNWAMIAAEGACGDWSDSIRKWIAEASQFEIVEPDPVLASRVALDQIVADLYVFGGVGLQKTYVDAAVEIFGPLDFRVPHAGDHVGKNVVAFRGAIPCAIFAPVRPVFVKRWRWEEE